MTDDTREPHFEVLVPDWLDVDEAVRRVADRAAPLPVERVDLDQALGRALGEDLAARATLPPWDNSAMDGYAVRSADVAGASPAGPVHLKVVARIRAGEPPGSEVQPGEAARIMTGAPVPPGADSVVRVEDTDGENEPGVVRVLKDRDAGRNVRPGGEDMQVGDLVLRRGDSIHPGTVGVLAALGRKTVVVHGRPEVAILTTGDELRSPERYGDVISGAGVPESNGPMLAAGSRAAGAVPLPLGVARDTPESVRERILQAGDAHALVTVGGASMGEADLVKRVLDELGFVLDFWRVSMRPGSPVSFGLLPREDAEPLPVFGLPGNPASAFVTFELFVRPFLLRLSGHRSVYRRIMRAVAGETLNGSPGRTMFLRVRVDDTHPTPTVWLTGPQGSGLVRSLSEADALAVVPARRERPIEAGEPVDTVLLGRGASTDWRPRGW